MILRLRMNCKYLILQRIQISKMTHLDFFDSLVRILDQGRNERIPLFQLEIADSHRTYSIGYSVIPLEEQGKRCDTGMDSF